MAVYLSKFQEAHRRLEMAIEADIRRTQIYNQPQQQWYEEESAGGCNPNGAVSNGV